MRTHEGGYKFQIEVRRSNLRTYGAVRGGKKRADGRREESGQTDRSNGRGGKVSGVT